MMATQSEIIKIHEDSFYANLYSVTHFRMIGLIDVTIQFDNDQERVTLAYYSSSGTNNGKIKGLWYPIVGIKMFTGPFIEFSDYLNYVLSQTTRDSFAYRAWLAKSLFFFGKDKDPSHTPGFSNSRYYHSLLNIGETLQSLYEKGAFKNLPELNASLLNKKVIAPIIYEGNQFTQKQNFERFIEIVFNESLQKKENK